MSSPYPILENRPIDQWKVTELREELKRRKLTTKGLKEDLVKRLDEALRSEQESEQGNTGDKVESEVHKVDLGDNRTPSDDGKVVEGEQVHSIGEEVGQHSNVETNVVVGETVDSAMALDGQDSQNQGIQNEGDSKTELQNPGSESSDVNAKIVSPKRNNQVSEVSPVLESHVNSGTVSTDISISEKIEIKNNVITDVKLEVDVKPEVVHLSSSNVVPGGESHPMDVEEPLDNKLSVEQGSIDQINDNRDSGSSEKLHSGKKSADDSMEANVSESKQIDSKVDTEKNGDNVEAVNRKVVDPDVVRNHITADVKAASIENKSDPAVQSVKRKANDDEAVVSKGTVKRQRRWNSENLEIPQNQSGTIIASTTPKNASHPTFKRSLSMSNSMASEELTKERVVPPSPKPATNSLRIDRFLRPFTLKAVQELLGKTGTVTSFWMDNIKTHCYVSYSSVEEANETRNALYNLQWPSNGGRLLVAEFVDPLEVKMHVEGPPQSPVTPATPVSMGPIASAAPPAMQAQPLRQQVQKKQLPPPPTLPPPPPLCNPPPMKERHTLPPPPPLPAKVDPPIVTLDDLFRKTRATPRVYYLPLSDEQVETKLKAQGKDTKQYAGLAYRIFQLWCRRSWFVEGFVVFRRSFWFETELDFSSPVGHPYPVLCSASLPKQSSKFKLPLLESKVLVNGRHLWISFRLELPCSSECSILKMDINSCLQPHIFTAEVVVHFVFTCYVLISDVI
nr:apoptotic chromatin condensation inducer in the nucleus-like [Ipomoea batatas]